MLQSLHIENIAVIEAADISFEAGLHVLTGETGAGKSIIIDSIGAVLGERTYRDMIRTGAEKAYVSAVFSENASFGWYENYGVPYDPDELLIQRELTGDGRSTCRVNGRQVTAAALRELGCTLISIHGQHDSRQLFDEDTHITILDAFACDDEARDAYTELYEAIRKIDAEIRKLSMDEGEKLRRIEMLTHQIKQISAAELRPNEDEELEDRRKLLSNSEKIADGLRNSCAAINGDDNGSEGAYGLLRQAEHELAYIGRFYEGTEVYRQKLYDLMYQVQDIGDELSSLKDSLDFSPSELERIEDRLDIIKKLRKRYGATIEEILEYEAKAKQELEQIELSDDRILQLQDERKKVLAKAEAAANALHEIRMKAGAALELRIQDELSQLDMPKVKFRCMFEEVPLCENGTDRVYFMMSANVGEDLKPISKVASGGELARIMLAIKNVMAEHDSIPTLIFDEVDAGVSGRAAQKVAVKLKSVSEHKQVLCVSHLPQIAAAADIHLLIAKQEKNGRTYTQVTKLDREGRVSEIARIIGGAEITETTRHSAEEMIEQNRIPKN